MSGDPDDEVGMEPPISLAHAEALLLQAVKDEEILDNRPLTNKEAIQLAQLGFWAASAAAVYLLETAGDDDMQAVIGKLKELRAEVDENLIKLSE